MPLETIIRTMKSKCVSKDTLVGLEGGEFLLHPQSTEILQWFKQNHPKFDLLSNCLKPDKLIAAVKAYTPHRLYLSLDGDKETYQFMRGCDGYDKVIRVVEECREIVPISLMFTLSPYNSVLDMGHVVDIAKKYDIDVRIGLYNNIHFFETSEKAHGTSLSLRNIIPENVAETSENLDFLYLYDEWERGKLKLNCYSIYDSLVIHPNGDVPICQNLGVILGNINENSLDEVFNSRKSWKLQKQYAKNCNGCWINFHRKYDIVLLRTLESFFPKKLIELFYGKYQWTDCETTTYKQIMSSRWL
jgi:MoaA/NifB/PqqE/SkfB family radical SAM enzyme